MHGHHRIHVVKQAGAQHVDLAGTAFLGRGAIEAQGAGALVGDQPFLHRDGRRRRGGAEQVMATAVPGAFGHQRAAIRLGGLRQPGQGVELADDANHGLA